MSMPKFTAEEVCAFTDLFARASSWASWQRRRGDHGEDVLEIVLEGDPPRHLKLAKSERFRYLATGFDGWGLVVCDEFSELLKIVSSYRPRAGAIYAGGVNKQAAA